MWSFFSTFCMGLCGGFLLVAGIQHIVIFGLHHLMWSEIIFLDGQ